MKLTPLLVQRLFDPFPLKSEPLEVKLVHDMVISLGMSCDDYIEILNSLMSVGRIVYPTGKAFNNSYMFKKGDPFRTMSFLKLKGCKKLSRLVSLDFKYKDLRTNPFKERELDAEQRPKSSFEVD